MLPHKVGIHIPKATTSDNRRRHGRIACEEVKCDLGTVLDLSGGGMSIRGWGAGPGKDEQVRVTIKCDGLQAEVMARVMWSKKSGYFHFEAGLKFEAMSKVSVAALKRIVAGSVRSGAGTAGL